MPVFCVLPFTAPCTFIKFNDVVFNAPPITLTLTMTLLNHFDDWLVLVHLEFS